MPKPCPIWLLSMDSDQFYAAPTTTATLKAYYLQYGKKAADYAIELVHFKDGEAALAFDATWQDHLRAEAAEAIAAGLKPVIGFSFYTWNAAEFISLCHSIKQSLPGITIIAGGPHVQQAEDYLGQDPIDYIFLGEAERSFTALLDLLQQQDKAAFSNTPGLAFLDSLGNIVSTGKPDRIKDLSEIPSPLNVLALTDANGKALYESISYETSRGCPFTCAFCEWGTGAIGTKMNQFPMQRIYDDWEIIIKAGIENIWLADSNFGALKEDLEKTQLICDLKNKYGLPRTFATSWSKKHSPQVQKMVLLLNQNGLLPHYQLALQTLTPLALELSNRKNMDANKYQPIAKQMAEAGVPIAAEMIWGLPGDNLKDFETNLDKLLAVFPSINIFAYTLLPGTEFYEKRLQYAIKTIPVAGYGKAKGEYVVGCHTFEQTEGIEGYYLISAHIILIHGHLLPLTTRYLALEGSIPVSPLLRKVLDNLLLLLAPNLAFDINDKMAVYENRNAIYLQLFKQFDAAYLSISRTVQAWLKAHNASAELLQKTLQHIQLDSLLTPLPGQKTSQDYALKFKASKIIKALDAMDLPHEQFYQGAETIIIETPGGVGEILKDPNGGSWLKGHIIQQSIAVELIAAANL